MRHLFVFTFTTSIFISLWVPVFSQPVDTAWVRFYNGTGDSLDCAVSMKIDNSGNIYVTGYSWDDITKEDFTTLKYSRTGNLLWTKRLDGAGEKDCARAMALDGAGNIYVTGWSTVGTYTRYLTVKYLSNGDTAWVRRYGSTGYNYYPSAITVDNAGNCYVTGMREGGASYLDYLTIKYNNTGETAWTRIYDGPDMNYDSATAIVVDNSGNVYVTGYSMENSMEDYLTIKYNALGNTIWTRGYTRASDSEDEALAMTLDNSGNLLVTGYSERGAGDFDFLTIKYYPNGDTAWQRRFNRPSGYDDIATSIMADNLNNVYVTGVSDQTIGTGNDYLTIKYDSYGNQQWTAYFDGNDNFDEPKAIARDGLGNIYITGKSYNSGSYYDYATVKYTSNGTEQWSVRYNGSANGNDEAWAIALDDSGKICVAGSVYQGTSDYDYGTIKYYQVNDVGVDEITTPTSGETLDCYSGFQPEASVVNYGGTNNSFTVCFKIYREGSEVYARSIALTLNAGETTEVTFDGILASTPGNYTFQSYTLLAGDMNPANDTQSGWFFVNPPTPQAWIQRADIKGGVSSKPVKQGGCLVGVRGTYIYGLKGNNTNEFYQYFINGDSWLVRCTIPYSPEKRKRVKRGAALCYDFRDTMIYALKGNNTAEFWRYDPNLDSWEQRRNLPELPSGKRVKGGSSLAFQRIGDDRYVYCLKGSKTRELWKYHINGDSWIPLQDVPAGPNLRYCKDGSGMVRVGDYLYVLKGNYHEFYAYNITDDTWITLESLPFYGSEGKRKKAKDGAATIYDGTRQTICLLKGGNCNEFWAYFTEVDSWTELPQMPLLPSNRKVKGGGALAIAGGELYAFKGNKTFELWMFSWDTTDLLFPANAQSFSNPVFNNLVAKARLGFSPNPAQGKVNIWFLIGLPTQIELKLFDVSGRCIKTLAYGRKEAGIHKFSLELKNQPAGVYVLSLDQLSNHSVSERTIQKLVIMK